MNVKQFKTEMNHILSWMNEKVYNNKNELTLNKTQYNELLGTLEQTPYIFIQTNKNDDKEEIKGYISLRDGICSKSNLKSPLLISETFNAYLSYALIYDRQLIELSEPLFLTIEPFYAGKPIDDISWMKKGSKKLEELYQMACQLDEEIDSLLFIINQFNQQKNDD